jgi:signal transduction histidine kinase
MSDQLAVVLIAAAWSGAVGILGFLAGWWLRRTSLRWLPSGVALVAVSAVVAGVIGTSRAMFLSAHDFHVVLLVVLVAGVVAVAFAMLAGASVVRSSRSLHEDTKRFAESGTFTSLGGGPVEFQQLSDELTRTSRRLAESRAREVRLDKSRRELVSWVSHDLRTPLAGLRAMAEALEDGMAEEPGRYHTQMRTEVDRMVRMVDDLFELSRINAGLITLAVQTVALGDLVSEAIAAADPVARAHRVHLCGSVEDGLLVSVDPGGLSRVLANLMMNGIRHTTPGGVVEIVGRAAATEVELSVRDACGGIPTENLDRVFDVAWRGSQARTPDYGGGAGLGLAIVKGLVEAHGGRVEVHNEAPGCRFVVRLEA